MRNILFVLVTGLSFTLTGCSSKKHHGHEKKSIVKLDAKSGSQVNGTLYLEDHYGGVIISGKISGLKPGLHGFHIHENGVCKGKDASAAGGHFHVEGEAHGDKGTAGSHLGDLGNIEANKEGVAEVNIHAKGLTLGKGDNSIANKSVVVHADSDDLKSQPAGNSGVRIACGVVSVKACDSCGDCGKGGCKMKENCGCKGCADKKKSKS